MSSFCIAITPDPNGPREMRVAQRNGKRVCCFKIGDTTEMVQRVDAYRSVNPHVSMKGSRLRYPVSKLDTGGALHRQYY